MLINFVASTAIFAGQFTILPAPQKITEHVYAWIGPYGGPNTDNKGYRMNMGFVVGKDAVLVFDTGFYPAMAKEMLGHIKKITSLPVKYAVNSNSQPHRYFGNSVFKEIGADIIAHEKEVERMKRMLSMHFLMLENSMKMDVKKIQSPAMPNIVLTKPKTIDLGGGVKVEITFHKAAHTPLPLVLHIPSDKLVYAGDILYSGRLLAVLTDGNISQWMDTFNYLQKFKATTFIPGHGKPSGLAVFEKTTLSYLKMLEAHMVKMVEEGVDMQDAIKKLDQSAYSKLENYEDLAGRNANIAYQEAERASFE